MSRTRRYGLWVVALGLPVAIVAVMSSLVVGQQGAAGGALDTMSQDANQWVMPLGNYSGMRHSKLNQITAQNVGRLQVAWTMSLGTLARPGRAAARHRQHDVSGQLVSQLRLRDRSQQLLAHRLEIRPRSGQARALGRLLRRRQPRRRVCVTARSSSPPWTHISMRSTPRPARCCGTSRTAIRSSGRR